MASGDGQVSVQPLSVGPIVGYTTHQSVRLWGRGESNNGDWCWGVARLKENGTKTFKVEIFKMREHFDYTAVVDFVGLSPRTKYVFEFGYVTAQQGSPDPTAANLGWKNASKGSVQTVPENDRDKISFIFGSCRYILRVFDRAIWDGRGDKVYRSINRQIEGYKEKSSWKDNDRDTPKILTDLILMIGDQIYADDLNFVNPDTGYIGLGACPRIEILVGIKYALFGIHDSTTCCC